MAARTLAEDRWQRDVTTQALFPAPVRARARVVAQGRGVLSGVAVAEATARRARLRVRRLAREGAIVRPGVAVLELSGDLRALLAVERSMLNFLMHLSGVATATRAAVRAASGARPPLAIYATRKTLPGLRDLEKGAVEHGGGHAHRRDLSDQILVKNNHLAFVSIPEAVRRARARAGTHRSVQIEVRSSAQALAAARAGAESLLIDNLSPGAARRIVRSLQRAGLRSGRWIELSGGLTARNLRAYRSVGANAASLGGLTHSAPALPFHLVLARDARSHAARRAA